MGKPRIPETYDPLQILFANLILALFPLGLQVIWPIIYRICYGKVLEVVIEEYHSTSQKESSQSEDRSI